MADRKALIHGYKQQKFRIGVYQLRCLVNGKILVGSSVNLDAIWNRIRSELSSGGHRNKPLQEDWNEHGPDSFRFEVLAEITQDEQQPADYPKQARELETLYIQELAPFEPQGYHNAK